MIYGRRLLLEDKMLHLLSAYNRQLNRCGKSINRKGEREAEGGKKKLRR